MSRHLTRIDEDLYRHFRDQAHATGSNSTQLINDLLRYALPLAEAGVFNLPHEIIFAALEEHTKRLIAMAQTNGAPPQAQP